MAERFPRNADEAMIIPAKDMMALAITHIHPLMAAYDRAATHFPIHPEMILWPIEGDGFLLRLLARELFCFEPGRYPLNRTIACLRTCRPTNEIHVFRDSREFLGVSFTPLWKDMEWYLARRRLDPLFVGRWWIDYDSPMNDHHFDVQSALYVRHGGRGSLALGRSRADVLGDASAIRARIRAHLDDAEPHGSFARRRFPGLGAARSRPRSPLAASRAIRVLAPTDEAFERAGFNRVPGDGMSAAGRAPRHRSARRAHHERREKSRHGQAVKTLAGRDVRLRDGERGERCGDNVVLAVDNLFISGKAEIRYPDLVGQPDRLKTATGVCRGYLRVAGGKFEPPPLFSRERA